MENKKLLLAVLLTIVSSNASATTVENVNYGDNPLFAMHYYNKGETLTFPGNVPITGFVDFTKEQRAAINGALSYVANLIGPQAKNQQHLNFYIVTDKGTDPNAGAITGGDLSKDPSWQGINSTDVLIYNYNGKTSPSMAGGYVLVERLDDFEFDVPASSVSNNVQKYNLNSVLIHEIGHALGIAIDKSHLKDDLKNPKLPKNTFAQHLYDANGKKYQEFPNGMIITYDETEKDLPDRFYTTKETDYSGAYFYGEHVAVVLNGAKLVNEDTGYVGADGSAVGIPINGYEGMDVPELSHISLRNGLMSHFDYRNWTTFMEAELALLQDLGYDMDRRNFFGYSVYNSGADIVNNNGYSARNDAGTEYIDAPNQTAYGIGLHVYGDDNKITQKGSINTEGYGAIGVRIDGFRNKVNVDAYVKSNGVNGTGIWVAYGAEHELTVNGNVQALGQTA